MSRCRRIQQEERNCITSLWKHEVPKIWTITLVSNHKSSSTCVMYFTFVKKLETGQKKTLKWWTRYRVASGALHASDGKCVSFRIYLPPSQSPCTFPEVYTALQKCIAEGSSRCNERCLDRQSKLLQRYYTKGNQFWGSIWFYVIVLLLLQPGGFINTVIKYITVKMTSHSVWTKETAPS